MGGRLSVSWQSRVSRSRRRSSAIVVSAATGLRLDLAFIAGAMVSATDPAAVVATFRRIRVPTSLATLVEMESLLNDGTGMVLFAMALAASTAVAPVSCRRSISSRRSFAAWPRAREPAAAAAFVARLDEQRRSS